MRNRFHPTSYEVGFPAVNSVSKQKNDPGQIRNRCPGLFYCRFCSQPISTKDHSVWMSDERLAKKVMVSTFPFFSR